jgi:hypothetical protein
MTTTTQSPRGPAPYTALLTAAVIALTVLCLLMVRQVRDLRARLTAAESALIQEQTRDSLAVGETVGPLDLVAADGSEHTVTFRAERPTLLLLTSVHCPYCDETIPLWQAMLAQTDSAAGRALDVLCIQADARTQADLKPLPPPLTPLFTKAAGGTWLGRIPIAPGAVLIDREATVRRTWFGIPSQRDRREMADLLLGADLPPRR